MSEISKILNKYYNFRISENKYILLVEKNPINFIIKNLNNFKLDATVTNSKFSQSIEIKAGKYELIIIYTPENIIKRKYMFELFIITQFLSKQSRILLRDLNKNPIMPQNKLACDVLNNSNNIEKNIIAPEINTEYYYVPISSNVIYCGNIAILLLLQLMSIKIGDKSMNNYIYIKDNKIYARKLFHNAILIDDENEESNYFYMRNLTIPAYIKQNSRYKELVYTPKKYKDSIYFKTIYILDEYKKEIAIKIAHPIFLLSEVFFFLSFTNNDNIDVYLYKLLYLLRIFKDEELLSIIIGDTSSYTQPALYENNEYSLSAEKTTVDDKKIDKIFNKSVNIWNKIIMAFN